MGTTCTYKPTGMPLEQFFIECGVLHWSSDLPYSYRVLSSAYKMPAFYAAIERIHKETGERVVWAAVIKITQLHSRDRYNFCYKDMDESMGPYYYDCPAKILDLLTPTDNEHANKWRAHCRENIEVAKERKKSLAPGVVLRYGDQRFTVIDKLPHGHLKVRSECGAVYRMRPGQVRDSSIEAMKDTASSTMATMIQRQLKAA